MSYLSKFVVALVGVLALAIVTSRQLFLFAVFSDPQGLIGSAGRGHHLWLAIGVGVEACIAGSLMFYFFLRYQNYKWSKILMTPAGPLLLAHGDKLSADVRVAIPFDPIRWALANPWLAEGQSDDRRPTNGSVAQSVRPDPVNGHSPGGVISWSSRNGPRPGTNDFHSKLQEVNGTA